MKKAAVLFAGVRYSCDAPLLYYARAVFRDRGYTVLEVSYGADMLAGGDLAERARNASGDVLRQLNEWKLEQYDDVVFVSKSIGTVLAGWSASKLPYPVRHIYLTPLEYTLPFLHAERDVVIGAGADPYLDAKHLTNYCSSHAIPCTMYSNVGHRLEAKGDIRYTLRILEEITQLYERF